MQIEQLRKGRSRLIAFFYRSFWMLLMLCMLAGCESKKTIVHGLDEREANDIVVFLDNKGIDATKIAQESAAGGGGTKAVLWDISVESSRATEAMAMLNAAGLPRRTGQNLLSIFSKGGLVPSETEEKIRYEAGLGEQIASTIRKIDGVLDADVQLSFPQQDPLNPNAQKQKVTASVYIKHTGVLDDPNTHLITKIRRLVASSIQGLDYDNVTIIPDRARMSEAQSRPANLRGEEKEYVSVWSIVIAQESLKRFRLIFFSFIVVTLILFLFLVWSIWKFYPLMMELGGVKQLFHLHPVHAKDVQAFLAQKGPPKQEEKKEEKKENEEDKDSGEAT